MKCGFCNYTDGLCYNSNPPQVKCRITGNHRFIGSDCDAFIETVIYYKEPEVATPCLICGEGVPCDIHCRTGKICDKCKDAIMHIRRELDKNRYSECPDE